MRTWMETGAAPQHESGVPDEASGSGKGVVAAAAGTREVIIDGHHAQRTLDQRGTMGFRINGERPGIPWRGP